MSQDPTRWSDASTDEAPPELRRLLQSAREDLPSKRELAALGIVLPAGLGTGTGTAVTAAKAKAATAAAKTGTMTVVSKVTGAAVLAVVAGASLYAAYSGEEAKPPAEEPPASQIAPMAPIVDEVAEPPVTTVEAAPEEESAATEAAPTRKAAPAKSGDELSLLQRARRALAKDPNEALALVRRHEREYPNGKYVQEREVIRIEALRNVGKNDEAERRGEEFKRRFPGSAHKSKLDREGR